MLVTILSNVTSTYADALPGAQTNGHTEIVAILDHTGSYGAKTSDFSANKQPGKHCDCKNDPGNAASITCGIVLALVANTVSFDAKIPVKCDYEWSNNTGQDLVSDPLKRPPRILL
ncbi:MAG: hypothetical protein AAGA76_10970 [Pseudomonadota bacterium]